ncbi:MAG TPA: OmpH family outer membrane protein [Bacteroidia bacterium]|nr:OmpH family outer membrane protein [Bacteroidia bacterium]
MKKIFKTVAILFVAVSMQQAVAQKIAHVQLDSLITIMPETKQAQDVAQGYLKDLEKQVASMKAEFDAKYQDYIANEASYSDLVKKTKQEELQTLNQRIEDFRAQAQQDYQKKSSDLSKPIYDKAKKAVDAVAKENGYKYVLDTSTGIVLFHEPSDDIFALVKKKLETMPAAVLPTGGSTTSGGGGAKTPGTGGAKTPAGGAGAKGK